ncbi:hypothetical protein Ddye_020370 [Dipteronia dyeriana]|uniref:RNase H type-1 domain-containing protein n=1 Tax=Dipteronia dyeriana TaxID=168575 RepID=A0AAD9U0N7_9ROSI|nr:hypothetical protein Ddye_020370 [Dipteronia dyeriana]
MACCSQRIEANVNKKVANLIAIKRGILFGIDCGLYPHKIESNDSDVVNWINRVVYRDSDFGTILLDIDDLRAGEFSYNFDSISTQANRSALRLAKYALDAVEDSYWMKEYPICIGSFVEAEKTG